MNIYYYYNGKLVKKNKVFYLESKNEFAYYMHTGVGAYSTDMLNYTVNSWTYFLYELNESQKKKLINYICRYNEYLDELIDRKK